MAAWDRRDNETTPAYRAFVAYLEEGPERGLRPLAQKLDRSLTLLGGWSSKHDWVDRARSWDADIERKRLAEAARQQQRRIDNMQRRQRIGGKRAMSAVLKALEGAGITIASATDLYRMAKVGLMLEAAGVTVMQSQQKLAVSGDLTTTAAEQAAPTPATQAAPDPGPSTLRKLELEIVGAGGQTVPASEIAAGMARWIDKPGDA